jgi:hypothetical protein
MLKRGSAMANKRRNSSGEAWGGLAMAAMERLELVHILDGNKPRGSGLYIGGRRDRIVRIGFGLLRLGYERGRSVNGVGFDPDSGGVQRGREKEESAGPTWRRLRGENRFRPGTTGRSGLALLGRGLLPAQAWTREEEPGRPGRGEGKRPGRKVSAQREKKDFPLIKSF